MSDWFDLIVLPLQVSALVEECHDARAAIWRDSMTIDDAEHGDADDP